MFTIGNKQEKRIRKKSGLALAESDHNKKSHSNEHDVTNDNDVTDKDKTSDSDVFTNVKASGEDYGSVAKFGVDTHALTEAESHDLESEGHRKLERTRVIILVTALSVHSLFEGLAMGLQSTNSAVWTLFLAIATHKAVIAFVTGLQITKSFSPSVRPVIISVAIFSVVSPLGGAIGTVIISIMHHHDSGSLDLVNAVLQSIAAGTFMYITFFEILVQSVSTTTTTSSITTTTDAGGPLATGNHGNVVRVFAVMLGFGLMAGLAVLH